ncbi:LemA family protein [Heyndrickxia acidicola]|uniref:LemA family protein n=1 Tax=Heyndrickxia acidicola TaxID=209389 RepID=A0ABU6ME45_9BACI|nr:LemA family protein [Heyndrickxia acidicola]MED1202932.1 LemA family protein [Heyndrickxia acidicola]
MRKKYSVLIGIVVVAVVIVIAFMSSYNGFVSEEENVNQSYSQIQNQLQRRMDLIPNLVNTVKGYAAHEEKVIKDISDARAQLAGAESPASQAKANDQLSGALNRLLAVSENYPDLKANQNFTQLMDELAGTENRIAVARRDYNNEVASYNKKVKRFPGAIVANAFGFHEKEYFQAAAGADKAPTVDFNSDKK